MFKQLNKNIEWKFLPSSLNELSHLVNLVPGFEILLIQPFLGTKEREREEEGSTLSLYCRPAKPVCEHAGCNRKRESFFSNIQWRVSENYGMRLSRWWRGSGFFLQINCLGSYDTAKRRKKSCSTNHIINPYLKNALKISSSSKS